MENRFKEEITVKKLFWNGLLNKKALPIVLGATFITVLWVVNGINDRSFVLCAIGLSGYVGYILLFHYRNAKREYKRIQEGKFKGL